MLRAQEIKKHTWVEVPASSRHGDAARRGETHCRIDRSPILHGSQARSAAEMGNHRSARKISTELEHDRLIGKPMKAIAANPFIEQLHGYRELCGRLGHGAMESGVEA